VTNSTPVRASNLTSPILDYALLLKHKHIPLTCFHSSVSKLTEITQKFYGLWQNLYLGCNGHSTSTTNQGEGIKFLYRIVHEPRVCSDWILFRVMACRGCRLVVFTFLYCMPQKNWEVPARSNQLTDYWELCLYSGSKWRAPKCWWYKENWFVFVTEWIKNWEFPIYLVN